MTDIDRIEEFDQLVNWLKGTDVLGSQAIAARAALRTLPAAMAVVDQNSTILRKDLFLLACLRATLASGVASTCPPADVTRVQRAARSAAYSSNLNVSDPARSATESVAHSARSAAFSAFHSDSVGFFIDAASDAADAAAFSAADTKHSAAGSTAHSAVFHDANILLDTDLSKLFATPLWPQDAAVKELLGLWSTFERRPDPNKMWDFWRRWYRGMLEGRPLDWDLQLQVALIDDAVWEAGAQAVAREIARIEAEHLSKKLPLAEEISLNEDTGKFSVAPIAVENAPLMAALMARISDEYEDALSGHNGLSETSGDGRRIRRATTRYANNPQQAELTLTTVATSLRRQIHETSELPDSPDNIALLEAVEDGVRGIRANHPEVAANREQLAQQALREITPEDREMLEKAAPVLTAISEGDLAKDFADDIPELINDALLPLPSGAPPLPGADASTRIFSRVSKMALMVEKVEKGLAKGAQAFDSDLAKTIRLARMGIGVAGGVMAFLYQLVQIGLRLFGVI